MTGFGEDNQTAFAPPLDKRAFLRWVQTQERRCELKDGRVVMQAGGSRRHARLIARFTTALSTALDPDTWAVAATELAVEIGEDIRYPDVLVERLEDDGSALSTDRPVLLVEVLSPTSVGTDMTAKLAEYTSLGSLAAYVVASQDEAILWVWERDPATRAFSARPLEVRGADARLAIGALSLSIPLADLYRGIAAV